ncbi:hypothetical protein DEU56DRAFT_900780 [Suillus clintonianus]|uniref:uncharacterized protein n=1 Tax=Suillus clintonianus TaxID=1904413 RepID=UPI001B87D626|nr:uncharacterized protein DEU56DRAFT_900780 [Suillus clintonianus]KAG2141098.1 hypothetical protein DEU56DRAFT_900780 [Suillus clintonianus]
MEQNVQPPSLQQKPLPAPLILNDYPDVPNVASSPTFSGQSSSHIGDILPPAHTHRTLVLCFDGTGDQFDSDNSNIVQLFSMLVKDDPTQQLVYYQAGIGTYSIPEMATPFMAKVSKTVDMMIGNHLNAHVMGGYEFLMQNYAAGDKICIFGFSRGAYTARALAGMIHKVGLLPTCNHQQVPFAYNMYSRDDPEGWAQSNAFKKAFSINVDIEFVGVWDTVSSVGIIPKRLPFTRANNNIKYFRHAISLDEHRVRFKPNLYTRPTEEDKKCGVKHHEMPRSIRRRFQKRQESEIKGSPDSDDTKGSHHHHHAEQQDLLERQYSTDELIVETNVEEVWFAGCHCDVGGGSVKNGTRNSLARIPLRWMIRQLFKLNIGILFHRSMFPKIGMDPGTLYPFAKRPPAIFQLPTVLSPPGTPNSTIKALTLPPPKVVTDDPAMIVYSDGGKFVSEELEDLADATSPMYDQLRLARVWWVLEVIPQLLHYQKDDDDSLVDEYTVNMGHGRHVQLQHKGVKVHRSVKIRMEADNLEGGKYWPKAKLKVEPEWVD